MILHVINSYSSTKLYKNLVEQVDLLGVPQVVYNPLRGKNKPKNKPEFKIKKSKIIYSKILNKYTDRVFYRFKINKIVKDIEKKVDFSTVKLIHAHTWYSDGGVAYKLAMKYKIPYIIAVRNTDINLFQKYFIHERSFGREILLNSSKIILISASYKKKVLGETNLNKITSIIESKTLIIPNGIDDYWLKNIYPKKKELDYPIKIIYIGKFNNGKNVINLQKAILHLRDKGIMCSLHLVGGGGSIEKEVLKMVHKEKDAFFYHGEIFDREKLSKLMRSCDIFAMPSKNETFGLVYIEALSQGLPIIYTKNEGIDGFYDNSIGEGVDNTTTFEIIKKLTKVIEGYGSYHFDQNLLPKKHDWKNIAKEYHKLYTYLIS
ncbi:glycosyltransferase family 4 protein [Tenacibaculum sp. FZY0031]|uniref:glycosyltransferase family 4 protein n=1 Tax=Tenacibaculum sp. FZY0031 TaxID=3116648 RepID=UPI002E99C9EA|nr:glycosyltransferase family 4 protein [Tenacibaculum sp. FZY0031]